MSADTLPVDEVPTDLPPYLPSKEIAQGRAFFVETYGCQMNVSDSEIVASIMRGVGFQQAPTEEKVSHCHFLKYSLNAP